MVVEGLYAARISGGGTNSVDESFGAATYIGGPLTMLFTVLLLVAAAAVGTARATDKAAPADATGTSASGHSSIRRGAAQFLRTAAPRRFGGASARVAPA
jgi:hypothetical protein